MKVDRSKAISAQEQWLSAFNLEEDPEVNGTPERVVNFWTAQLLHGYQVDPKAELGKPLVTESSGLICMRNIPFHGVCPHHLVPYFGTVDLAYEPTKHILGFGRFERFLAACSRKLVLQEKLTYEVAHQLHQHVDARGTLCRITAQHLCFMLDGREPRGTEFTTWQGVGTLENRYEIFSPTQINTVR